jgi:hypothetical protein
MNADEDHERGLAKIGVFGRWGKAASHPAKNDSWDVSICSHSQRIVADGVA